jgi:RHH-type rel operon transcriptional repressor/antitoxin RelB
MEHLDDMEDIYIAERELEGIRAGRIKTIPLEDVMKKYDLASKPVKRRQRTITLTNLTR